MYAKNFVLKEMRTKRGLSSLEFANMAGLSPSYFCMIENGKRNLTSRNADKILRNIVNLTEGEKIDIFRAVEETKIQNTKGLQKEIKSLIAKFFYYLNNNIVENAKNLAKEIIKLISKLMPKDMTEEMMMFNNI
jgi:transcriptional regulator with XRE-family HTH domain